MSYQVRMWVAQTNETGGCGHTGTWGKTKDFIRIAWQRNSQLRHSVHPLMVRRLGAAGGGTLPVSITWSYQIADSFDRL